MMDLVVHVGHEGLLKSDCRVFKIEMKCLELLHYLRLLKAYLNSHFFPRWGSFVSSLGMYRGKMRYLIYSYS